MNIVIPEYEENDTVAFLDEASKVTKGVVECITQTIEDNPKTFYKLCVKGGYIVLPEERLLFNEIRYIKPLFAIGMTVKDALDTEGIVSSINIEVELDEYTIQYILHTGDVLDEDDIVEVINVSH